MRAEPMDSRSLSKLHEVAELIEPKNPYIRELWQHIMNLLGEILRLTNEMQSIEQEKNAAQHELEIVRTYAPYWSCWSCKYIDRNDPDHDHNCRYEGECINNEHWEFSGLPAENTPDDADSPKHIAAVKTLLGMMSAIVEADDVEFLTPKDGSGSPER